MWQTSKETHDGAYRHWERFLRREREPQDSGAPWFVPVYVRLAEAPDGGFGPTITALLDQIVASTGAGQLLIERSERRFLERVRHAEQEGGRVGETLHAVIYRREGAAPGDCALYEEVHAGAPVLIRDLAQFEAEEETAAPAPRAAAPKPLMGVIDAGIGFLNARFRRAPERSRVRAVWLQALEQRAAARQPGDVHAGLQLSRDEIETMIGQGDEAAAYAKLERALFDLGDDRPLSHRTTHGTHVMDIACGRHMDERDPEGLPVEDILAVQLPPEAVKDTSGRRLDSYVLMGLRWMMLEALDHAKAHGGATVPLVVNISFGTFAGPKDGTGFLEAALRREAAHYGRLSDALFGEAFPMRVVLAFGNGYRRSQLALTETGMARPLEWCLKPDDRTASYLEIRCPARGSHGVSLSPPGMAGQPVQALDPGSYAEWIEKGIARARIYREPDEPDGRAVYILALRPTADPEGHPVAAAGRWLVGAVAEGRISFQVQRDETLPGFRPHGRQSYLEDRESRDWDCERRAYSRPGTTSMITREGTHSAQVSPDVPPAENEAAFYVIGATYGFGTSNTAPRPAPYSASGSVAPAWTTRRGPSLSAVGEEGHALPGLRASGTRSGSTARIGGTSVAAPQAARGLLRLLVTHAMRHTGLAKTQQQEITDLLKSAGTALPLADARRGAGVLRLVRS